MSWSKQRKTTDTLIVLAFFVGVGTIIALPFLLRAPTCFDGKQNGTETGVDCGGGCSVVCVDTSPLRIVWERVVEYDTGVYDLVALLENRSDDAAPRMIEYKADVFDTYNINIGTFTGTSVVRSGLNTALHIPNTRFGTTTPARVRFSVTDTDPFERVNNRDAVASVVVVRESFENITGTSRLIVQIKNNLFAGVTNVPVRALLFDEEDTLIAVGSTVVDEIKAQGEVTAYFVWRKPVSRPARTDIQILISPVR